MKTLLRIDSSLRHTGSYSRTMGDYFVARWVMQNAHGRVVVRDLEERPIPHLTQTVAEAFFTSERKQDRLVLSDELIREINACDEILVTCPMYNFQIPSSLKAYLDHVVRSNETFRFAGGEYQGLLNNKRAFFITAMGGRKASPGNDEAFENYLKGIFGFIGIKDTATISIDGTADANYASQSVADARELICTLIN